jgi:hypothetical protein
MRYRLIKEYPFSPKLNSIVCTNALEANQEGLHFVGIDYINKFLGEYFEEIKDGYRFLVYIQDRPFCNAWKVIEFKKQPEDYNDKKDSEFRRFFKTKEEATEYILMNKPCLSYNDVSNMCILFKDVNWDHFKTTIDLEDLTEIIKKKL